MRPFASPARSSTSANTSQRSPDCWGRARPELRPDIRSIPFKNYLIFFRYLPSGTDRDIFEVVNVIESHRDLVAYFHDED
jgi:toxin ParE1/3/4